MTKIKELISEAYVEPKDRHRWVGISEKGKEQRKDEKRKRGSVKEGRRIKNNNFDDDY